MLPKQPKVSGPFWNERRNRWTVTLAFQGAVRLWHYHDEDEARGTGLKRARADARTLRAAIRDRRKA